MGSEIGSVLSLLGDSLRAAREQCGLTLERAAELSGLSKSHLSRLESSERQPSVAALLALSDTYRTTVGALFGESAEGQASLGVFPPDQPQQAANGLSIAACSGYPGSSVIDALRLSVHPDRVPPMPARHPGEECIFVIGGTLNLEFDGELHRLAAGTVAHFNAEVPHRIGAEGATAEVLLVAAKPLRPVHTVH